MANDDTQLRDAVRNAWPKPPTTGDFAATWQQAEARYTRQRRRWPQAVGLVAAVAIAALTFGVFDPDETWVAPEFVDPAELLGSTSWSAPSDVLMPEHRFDIYQELPALIESTPPAGGSLL